MRRYLPTAILGLAGFVPLTLLSQTGCDLLKGKADPDAGVDGAIVVAPVVDAAVAPVDTATATGTAPPLTTSTVLPPSTNTAVPTARTDAGAAPPVADAGAKTDAGGPAPTPTPTLTIPSFDAGLLPRFDAGGFKPPWVK